MAREQLWRRVTLMWFAVVSALFASLAILALIGRDWIALSVYAAVAASYVLFLARWLRRPPSESEPLTQSRRLALLIWLAVLVPLIVWFVVTGNALAGYVQIAWTFGLIAFLYTRRLRQR